MDLSPPFYLVCIKRRKLFPSLHVEVVLYADDTAIVAAFRKLSLVVSYLETHLYRLEHMTGELLSTPQEHRGALNMTA
jgi:hypothetical protein